MSKSDTRKRRQQCEEILLAIVRSCDTLRATAHETPRVAFYPDWGFPSVTLTFPEGHTHVGMPDQDWGSFVDALHRQLTRGEGLSIVPSTKEVQTK